jgi:phosphatidylglycerophosphate synthase
MQPQYCRGIIISLIAIGLLTDIFDGIIARRLGISTEKMRRLDSSVDMVFWVMVLIAACILSPTLYLGHIMALSIVFGLEAIAYIVCFIRFRKEVATHAILSKIWALSIFAVLIQSVATATTGWTFTLCIFIGIVSRLEILFILFIVRRWTNDVPSLYHAVLLRQGKPIKRSKWFNG